MLHDDRKLVVVIDDRKQLFGLRIVLQRGEIREKFGEIEVGGSQLFPMQAKSVLFG